MFLCDKAFEVQSRGLMEAVCVPVDVRVISAGKVRRYAHLSLLQHLTVKGLVRDNLKDTFKIGRGFFQALQLIRQFKPDVVFTKGGFVCLPVGLAAHVLKVPLVIHDSDTRPGLTNTILGRWAQVITTGSPLENYQYPTAKSHFIGVPVNARYVPKTPVEQRKAKKDLGFDPNKMLVVAVGGGLGAVSINTAMNSAAQTLLGQGIAVYMVAGKGYYDQAVAGAPVHESYKVVPFVYEKMDEVLGAADIVVSRGSATFLQELAGLGKAVIIVPAYQLGDQLKNAKVFSDAGAALVVDDQSMEETHELERAIVTLADDPLLREELGKKLHTFARPNAAKELAELIVTAAKR